MTFFWTSRENMPDGFRLLAISLATSFVDHRDRRSDRGNSPNDSIFPQVPDSASSADTLYGHASAWN